MMKVPHNVASFDELRQLVGERVVVRMKRLMKVYLKDKVLITSEKALRCASVALMFCTAARSGNAVVTAQFDELVEDPMERSFMWDSALVMMEEMDTVDNDALFWASRHKVHAYDDEVLLDRDEYTEVLRSRLYAELMDTAAITCNGYDIEVIRSTIAKNDLRLSNPELFAMMYRVPTNDPDKIVAGKCAACFYGDVDGALSFIRWCHGKSNQNIIVRVAELVYERKISEASMRHDLWECLWRNRIYTASEQNWDWQLKKHLASRGS